MNRRKPFFIRGNFQLEFVLGYVTILSAGIAGATALIYYHLEAILEKAAFSSHLRLGSSHELFWGVIFKVNFFLACASILVGLAAIAAVYFYLEAFFLSISIGLKKLTRGRFSFRLRPRRLWGFKVLTNEFNEVAGLLEREAAEINSDLETILVLLKSPTVESFRKIKKLHAQIQRKLFER